MTVVAVRHPIRTDCEWYWPIDLERYDRAVSLSAAEKAELALIAARTGGTGGTWPARSRAVLQRLLEPIVDVLNISIPGESNTASKNNVRPTIRAFVVEMHRRQISFWGWSEDDWKEFIQPTMQAFNDRLGWHWSSGTKSCSGTRTRAAFVGYVLNLLPDPRALVEFRRQEFAVAVFGEQRIDAAIAEVSSVLLPMGYSATNVAKLSTSISEVLLLARTPDLRGVTADRLKEIVDTAIDNNKPNLALLAKVMERLGFIRNPLSANRTGPTSGYLSIYETVSSEWAGWCDLWRAMSTLAPRTKDTYHRLLLMIGRWLQDEHPETCSPAQWDAGLAIEAVAALCKWKSGQYSLNTEIMQKRGSHVGKPIKPRSIAHYIAALRTFFIDLQVAEKIPVRFSPQHYMTTPRTVLRKITPDPRVIDKTIWAKLVWAGQNLEESDLPARMYPLAFVRAVAAVWLFTALRSDEVSRLTVGCIEWPQTDIKDMETGRTLPSDSVCYLLIPPNKTTGAFRKPVAPYVGKTIQEWQLVRPTQSSQLDEKGAEMVDYLFSVRGKKVSKNYINNVLIPMLCRKGGLSLNDHRGPITSHRARATIATYLGNCENPMTLIQLMKWLGHRNPDSTRNYVEADVSKMAVKVADGSFFQQNLASVPVIIDSEAIRNQETTWKYFDLGHGLCKLSEWSSCRHRMACARCDFFEPKDSMRFQLLEANGNLTKMLEFVALGNDERQLVEQGLTINQELLSRLQSEPTPSGQTPEQLHCSACQLAATTTVHLVKQEVVP